MLTAILTTGTLLLLLFLAGGFFIPAALGGLGFVLDNWWADGVLRSNVGRVAWEAHTSFVTLSIPFFLLMGELVQRGNLSAPSYRVLSRVLRWLPGGLLHTNIAACALFAAVSGSSVATAATIGSVAYPAMRHAKYHPQLVAGSLAAGGTLGILIPPSIPFILYGLFTDTSIGRLFAAGILPGILMALLFMAFIYVVVVLHPAIAPPAKGTDRLAQPGDVSRFLLTGLLALTVLGSIYTGWATPSEAAAVGVVGAFLISAVAGAMNLQTWTAAVKAAMGTTGMVLFLIMAAVALNFVLTFVGVGQLITQGIAGIPVTPLITLLFIILLYLLLGMFMDSLTMLIVTLPTVFPVVTGLGYDPVWFGVILVILIEAGLLTPPVGVNLFVIQSIRPDKGPFGDVVLGALPFVVIQTAMIGVLIAFPAIALWLPDRLFG